jgi:hypothetical protein
MKLTNAQREEFFGIMSRGNKAEGEVWLKDMEAGFPPKPVAKVAAAVPAKPLAPAVSSPAKAAPSKWQADLLAKSKAKK